jgi:hypothetical protein
LELRSVEKMEDSTVESSDNRKVLSLVAHLASKSEIKLESQLVDYLVAKMVYWRGMGKAERKEFQKAAK